MTDKKILSPSEALQALSEEKKLEKLREILNKLTSFDRDESVYATTALSSCADELLACVKILNDMTGCVHGEDCNYEEDEKCECGLLEAQEAIAALSAKLEAVE